MNGLLKGTAWFVIVAVFAWGAEMVLLAVLAWAEMALRAAILDKLDEMRVSRSFLDGGLTELAAEGVRCWEKSKQ